MSKSNHSSDYNILKNSLLFNNAMGGLWTDNADETFVVMGPDSWFWHGAKAIVRESTLNRIWEYKKYWSRLVPRINTSMAKQERLRLLVFHCGIDVKVGEPWMTEKKSRVGQ